jgi:hypothetical protein
MKPVAIVFLFALAVFGAVDARAGNPETILFSGHDYRFVVTPCKAEAIEKEKKQSVTLTVSCEFPKDS